MFPHLKNVLYVGKAFRDPNDLLVDASLSLLHRNSDFYDPDEAPTKQFASKLSNILRNSQQTVLVSFEEVLSATLKPRVERGIFARVKAARTSEQQLLFVKEIMLNAGDCEPCVIICLRDQVQLLASFYAQHYRFFSKRLYDKSLKDIAGARTFSEYVQSFLGVGEKGILNPVALDYCQLEERCVEIFGERNVSFLAYEWLRSNPELYAQKLGGFLDCDPSDVLSLIARAPHENVRRRVDSGGNVLLRVRQDDLGSYALRLKTKLLPNFNSGLGAPVMRILQRVKLGPANLTPRAAELNRIREHYAESNKKFIERHPEFEGSLSVS